MTLEELHALLGRVIEEQPLLGTKNIRYVTSTVSYPIDGVNLSEIGDLTLRADDFIHKDKIWLP
jgi:hypothetical protein